MILPIVAYGDPVLKKKALEITKNYPALDEVISNMFETMYKASGLGLAAPQVGLSIRLFIVDASPFKDKHPELEHFRKIFINPIIVDKTGEDVSHNEGCLSIPGIREDIYREPTITLEYYDENFEFHSISFDGMPARIIQHEYDHIEGILFTDHLSSLKRRLIRNRMNDISQGKVDVDYKMKFYNLRR